MNLPEQQPAALADAPDGGIPPTCEAAPSAGTSVWRSPVSRRTIAAMVVFYLADTLLMHVHKLAGSAALLAGLAAFARPLARMLGSTLVSSWRTLQREVEEERAEAARDDVDLRPLWVLCTAAVSLTLIEYFGDRGTYGQMVGRLWPSFAAHRYYELSTYAYWTGARFAGYVVIPWLLVLFMKGERIRDYGLSARGTLRHLWIYGALYLIVLPAVVMVSFTQSFQHTYPFYDLAGRSWFDLFAWEALYALQFFALEVFFRGFMLHPLRRSMGPYAIFAMAVPYCMIHYSKPLPEVLGAVVAGIVLGTLSLRTGSIWCGVLIHVSVAWTMDGLSLAHTVGWPGRHTLVRSL